jgi:hypothetical protein
MTIGGNKDGGTIHLTAEEQRFFNDHHPVIKRTAYRKGIVEITVHSKIVCPNANTRFFLRNVFNGAFPNILASFNKAMVAANLTPAELTVQQTVALLGEDKQFNDTKNDLTRYIESIGGEVPITEIMGG